MDRLGTTRRTNPGGRYSGQCNYTSGDALQQFKSAMLDSIGTAPDEIIPDGSLHRFKIDGKLNGSYVLHLDGRTAGYFEDFKQGIKVRWKLKSDFKPLTQTEKQTFAIERQRQSEERQTEEAAKHKAAAGKAVYIWNHAKPAPVNHPYLINKRIKPHGARLGRDNTLIIPLYNASRELVNLQFIQSDGTKRFLSGGLKKGCFYPIGNIRTTDKILIGEGLATCGSLHEHTGKPVVIAFDAGNLKAVAETIRAIMPNTEIIIAADNDESGIGELKAREAALSIGCKYIIPPIVGQDFNDYLAGSV